MKTAIYEPSSSLAAKVSRRFTPYLARKPLKFSLDRPIVSFTFDDCPKSALTNGLKILEAKGWKSTIYVAAGLFGVTNHHGPMASPADIRAAHRNGHEIGGHSYSHIDMSRMDVSDVLCEIDRNQDELVSYSIPQPRSFAFPYGEASAGLKSILGMQFEASRGIIPGVHTDSVDLNQIKSEPIFSSKDIEGLLQKIKALKTTPGWMTTFTHDVRGGPSLWGCTPEDFQRVVDAVQDIDAHVMTVIDAVDHLKGLSE